MQTVGETAWASITPGRLGHFPHSYKENNCNNTGIHLCFHQILNTFLQHAKEIPLPAWRRGKIPWHAGEQTSNLFSHLLANFPINFWINFLGNPGKKIKNGNHMITRHLATDRKYKQVPMHPKYNRMTGEVVHHFTMA